MFGARMVTVMGLVPGRTVPIPVLTSKTITSSSRSCQKGSGRLSWTSCALLCQLPSGSMAVANLQPSLRDKLADNFLTTLGYGNIMVYPHPPRKLTAPSSIEHQYLIAQPGWGLVRSIACWGPPIPQSLVQACLYWTGVPHYNPLEGQLLGLCLNLAWQSQVLPISLHLIYLIAQALPGSCSLVILADQRHCSPVQPAVLSLCRIQPDSSCACRLMMKFCSPPSLYHGILTIWPGTSTSPDPSCARCLHWKLFMS